MSINILDDKQIMEQIQNLLAAYDTVLWNIGFLRGMIDGAKEQKEKNSEIVEDK